MYHLCSLHSFFVVLFVWCTVVYAHGRTYIDVSFSCLYGVPLVYARGRTHIDRAFTWCTICTHTVSTLFGVYGYVVRTIYVLHTQLCVVLFVWCTVVYAHGLTYTDVSFSCLYGVPLVYARGRTHIDRALCVVTWCTIYVCLHVLSWSYSHRWLFIMFVCCTVCVRTHRTYIAGLYCDCVVYRMSGWCTVYVLSCTHFDRSCHVCTVYR